MMSSEDFILKFHSLEGITLGERKKSFFVLLRSIDPSTHVIDDIICKLKPSTYLEETYKIELLIHFRRTNDLIEILIGGDEIGARRIVRQKWFVQELINKYSPTQFMEKVVPRLSFSIRTKLFKKIFLNLKDVYLIEEFFETLLNLYGISSALVFLPGCTNLKIEEILTKYSIKFTAALLKSLYHKDKNLIVVYFKMLSKNDQDVDKYKWRSFFSYVGKTDPLFYFDLCEEFHVGKLKLGRRSTKKFVDIKRIEIVNKPVDYYRFLRKDALVRKLGTDFPIFFKNLFPEYLDHFHFNYNKSLIKFYPKNKQYKLYLCTFEEVFKKSLWDQVQFMDEKLIEFIPDRSEREKWIAKFENRQNINKYKLKKRKYAMFFTEDKEEIVIKDKKTIFNTLISTCKLMNDYDSFINILKSFCERHRNSDVTIIYNFLRTVFKELDLSKFGEEHWQYIYYIISIQLFKKQQVFHPIYVEYIKYLYLNKKAIHDHVLTLLNEAPLALSKFEYDNKNFQKDLHFLFLELLPKVTNKQNEIAIEIALSIMRWNAKYPLETIPFSEDSHILNAVNELHTTEKVNNKRMKVLKYLICKQDKNQMSSNIVEMYWSNYKKLSDDTITNWFMKYKPMVLKEYLNNVKFGIKNSDVNLVRCLKKYSHLEIPQSIIESCFEDLETADSSKCFDIIRISVLFMESADLQLFMQKYIPQVERIDVECDETTQKTYAIQQALARYCKLSSNMNMLYPILLNYCKGDFFKSSLPSLYSSFHRIPENQLYSALEQLNNKAVSVRKHTIFLTALILPIEKIVLKFEEIQSSEENASVKEHMFISCYKFFIRNETHKCWEILKKYLTQLKKNQKNVLKMITRVDFFPVSYRPEYTEIVWNILENYKKQNENINENMLALINNLTTKDVTCLNVEFCFDIIENKLFDRKEFSFDENVFDFARKFLLYGQNSARKADLMCKIFLDMKTNSSKDIEKNKEFICVLHKICFRIVKNVLTSKTGNFDVDFANHFKVGLTEIFSSEEIFEETLLLDLMQFKIECDHFEELLPGRLSRLFSSLLEKYGNLVQNRFNNFLRMILDVLYVYDDFALLNFLNLFMEGNSLIHTMSVIQLLPHVSCTDTDEKTRNAYEELVKKIEYRDPNIKIYLYGKLKDI